MLSGRIYLKTERGLVAMTEVPYSLEDDLQVLVAEHPDLLAGEQMRPGAPRRWLLIQREAGIEDAVGAQARWSLDHIFIDQEAIPTLVEVKRSSDTRLRREVVGQMLDYAANVVAHWPPGELRRRYEERADAAGQDPDSEVLALLADAEASTIDTFWATADANLAARRIRLVFLADVVPPELLRIIEFLNENLVRAEVFAVEVRQFVGEGHQTLVPRVLGRTMVAETVKASASTTSVRRSWTEDQFREAAAAFGSPAHQVASAVFQWLEAHQAPAKIGAGKYGPLYFVAPSPLGDWIRFMSVNTEGYVGVNFDTIAPYPPFDSVEARRELTRRLNEIPGAFVGPNHATNATWCQIRASLLTEPAALRTLMSLADWVCESLSRGT